MATLLLERRKHAIGNTFVNVLEVDTDVDNFKLDAVWTLPGSCRRRAHSVQASFTDVKGSSSKSACDEGAESNKQAMSDDEIDLQQVQSCIIWDDTDDEVEHVRASTAPSDMMAAPKASTWKPIDPIVSKSSEDNHISDTCPKACNLSMLSPHPRSPCLDSPTDLPGTEPLPHLLGRLGARRPETKVQSTAVLGREVQWQAPSRSNRIDEFLPETHKIIQEVVTVCHTVEGSTYKEHQLQRTPGQQHLEMDVPQSNQHSLRKGMKLSIAEGIALQSPDQVRSTPRRLDSYTVTSGQSPEYFDDKLETDLPGEVTTMMIRNLPRQITQKDLLDELDTTGFKGLYDFCYMPCCFSTGEGKGFAFMNLISTSTAGKFVGAWHKTRRFGMDSSDASLNISPAAIQGLEANVKKWNAPRMKRIRNPNLRPYVATDRSQKVLDASLQSLVTAMEASNPTTLALPRHHGISPQMTPGRVAPQPQQQVSPVHAPGVWSVGDSMIRGNMHNQIGRSSPSPFLCDGTTAMQTPGAPASHDFDAVQRSRLPAQPLFSTPPPFLLPQRCM